MIQALIFLFVQTCYANLLVIPRLEQIGYREGSLASRALLKVKANALGGPLGVYFEGFAEAEGVAEQREMRRTPTRAYLQEGYFEARFKEFYLRAGVQSQRWSEMWVTPSLDIWTGRRWNRLFFDPLTEQLTHPSGVLATYAGADFSIDLMAVERSGENIYPQPFPERTKIPSEQNVYGIAYGGARLKWNLAGAGLSTLAAQNEFLDIFGGSINFAFDHWIPKMEIGFVNKKNDQSLQMKEMRDQFVAVGTDLFFDSWTFQPQATFFNFNSADASGPQGQNLFYFSGTYTKKKLEFQIQGILNGKTSDSFASVLLGWNWNRFLTTWGFVQDYEGEGTALSRAYRQITQGWVVGVRLEANFGFGD